MPSGHGERYDFFLSRRGSVAAFAQEVTASPTVHRGAAAMVGPQIVAWLQQWQRGCIMIFLRLALARREIAA